MLVIFIMLVGVLIGYKWFPQKHAKKNLNLQIVCIAVLIFAMGVKLGSRENFLQEISDIGMKSLLFAILPILFSVALVFPLTEKFVKRRKKKSEPKGEADTW